MKTKKFKEISNEWIELKKLSVKYPTIAKYRVVIDTQLAHQFNDYTMEQFNEDIIIAYFNKLSTKENYANSTLLSIRYVLRAIINYSHQKYKTNNCSFELIKIAKKQRQINTLSNSQKINLSNYCFNNFQPISIAVAISLYTGLRIGEICALKWEDINFEDNYIYVYKTVERLKSKENTGNKTALMILNPKTSSSKRIVPIPLFLNEFLVNYKSRYQIEDNNVFIITGNNKIPDPRTTQYRFNKLCKQFDFNTNFHTLRHSYATNCVMNGVDTKSLSEMLGHSNVGTTLNLYVHSSLEFKKKQINKISRL